ncbi:MAG: hypothetical protein MK089_04470 [Phycisphaerales bacterium]|nr:hypothetical protein [Phycisphaerales bacterium]
MARSSVCAGCDIHAAVPFSEPRGYRLKVEVGGIKRRFEACSGGSTNMRFTMKSIAILFLALSVLAILASGQEDSRDAVKRLPKFSDVLEPPVLKGIEVVDDDLVLEMQWESRWTGGELDIPGTLFLDHCEEPAGRAIALSIDASALAMDSNCRVRIPLDREDQSSQILRQAAHRDLRVMFSSGY